MNPIAIVPPKRSSEIANRPSPKSVLLAPSDAVGLPRRVGRLGRVVAHASTESTAIATNSSAR